MLFDTAREERFPEVFRFVLIFLRRFTGSEKNRFKDRPLQVQEEAKGLRERGIGHLGGYRREASENSELQSFEGRERTSVTFSPDAASLSASTWIHLSARIER